MNEYDGIDLGEIISLLCEKFHWTIDQCLDLTTNQIVILSKGKPKSSPQIKKDNPIEKIKKLKMQYGRNLTPVEVERIMLGE